MRLSFLPALAMATALSGCLQDLYTDSGFTNVTSTGSVTERLGQQGIASVIDADGDGFAYSSGTESGGGLRAVAGFTNPSDIGLRPVTSVGRYTGRYELIEVYDIDLRGGFISGSQDQVSGSIVLNADFSTGTLTGRAGELSVSGRALGSQLTGGVQYRGVSGDLRGVLGDDKAIGAFHGNDADLIYAGGFLTYRD
ncbi:hypothetical protein SAMN05444003_0958 [Cognatiyoonia sediminum]|uniref:Transferrin-binding protein B C-lobe/N-lobe beta barrel domain-containing protein n=1 Tax=Cognatiyoonia sediminum TaxID=1508389 RepID=A0A1M5MQK2_9RHOB|nr:hypothetical protein [Cognatiyoonia sediminum]SHG79505.1 hypothetical protein SAMN05444003_0958 [Cognatiyoonia sediminum]